MKHLCAKNPAAEQLALVRGGLWGQCFHLGSVFGETSVFTQNTRENTPQNTPKPCCRTRPQWRQTHRWQIVTHSSSTKDHFSTCETIQLLLMMQLSLGEKYGNAV